IAVKYFPVAYLPSLVLRRRWRVIAGTIAIVFVLWLVATVCMGWVTVGDFVRHIAPPHLGGNIVWQSNNGVLFKSWNSFLRRVFIFDRLTNPAPLFDASAGYGWALGIVYCGLAYVFSIGWKALTKLDSAERFYQEFAYISVAAFVILP